MASACITGAAPGSTPGGSTAEGSHPDEGSYTGGDRAAASEPRPFYTARCGAPEES